MFYLWWRMDAGGRRRVWRLYGSYTLLMACGSCFGVVTWAARMLNLVAGYSGNDLVSQGRPQEAFALFAVSFRWRTLLTVT